MIVLKGSTETILLQVGFYSEQKKYNVQMNTPIVFNSDIILFPVLSDVASENNKKAMNMFSKAGRGGSLQAVEGAAASSRGSVKDVWKEFNVRVIM